MITLEINAYMDSNALTLSFQDNTKRIEVKRKPTKLNLKSKLSTLFPGVDTVFETNTGSEEGVYQSYHVTLTLTSPEQLNHIWSVFA